MVSHGMLPPDRSSSDSDEELCGRKYWRIFHVFIVLTTKNMQSMADIVSRIYFQSKLDFVVKSTPSLSLESFLSGLPTSAKGPGVVVRTDQWLWGRLPPKLFICRFEFEFKFLNPMLIKSANCDFKSAKWSLFSRSVE